MFRTTVIAGVIAAIVLPPLAYVAWRDASDEPSPPVLVDPVAGVADSVRLGDTRAGAVAKLGPAPPWNGDQSVEPLEEDWDEIGAPSTMSLSRPYVLRYPHTTVELDDGRVVAIVTAERNARTPVGVRVGDALEEARRAYPALRCWDAPAGGGQGTYPVCSGRLRPGRWLWFGEDPIRSISIASRRLG
jgi:hypothetical protein